MTNRYLLPAKGQKIYYVATTGNDTSAGTEKAPWRTLSYAVSNTSPVKAGDTILVQPGTYNEVVTLGKSGDASKGHIRLKGNGPIGSVRLIDPEPNVGGFRKGTIRSEAKSYWIIEGFRIERSAWAGICLMDASNMIVQGNSTWETGASGIIIMPLSYYDGGEKEVTSKNIKILKNNIERANWKWTSNQSWEGDQEAMSIWGVDGFIAAHNYINQGNREGLDCKVGTRNGLIHDNILTGIARVAGTPNGYHGGPALYIDANRANIFNLRIYNNTVFSNVADGILLASEAPDMGDVKNVWIYNNVVYENGLIGVNGGRGITVDSNCKDVYIYHNTLYKNVQGIYISADYAGYKPNNVVIQNNLIADSTFRNAYFGNAENINLSSNMYTAGHERFYDEGTGLAGLTVGTNTRINSANFTDATNKDFHLKSDSPARGVATAIDHAYIRVDRDMKNRPLNGANVGAYA